MISPGGIRSRRRLSAPRSMSATSRKRWSSRSAASAAAASPKVEYHQLWALRRGEIKSLGAERSRDYARPSAASTFCTTRRICGSSSMTRRVTGRMSQDHPAATSAGGSSALTRPGIRPRALAPAPPAATPRPASAPIRPRAPAPSATLPASALAPPGCLSLRPFRHSRRRASRRGRVAAPLRAPQLRPAACGSLRAPEPGPGGRSAPCAHRAARPTPLRSRAAAAHPP